MWSISHNSGLHAVHVRSTMWPWSQRPGFTGQAGARTIKLKNVPDVGLLMKMMMVRFMMVVMMILMVIVAMMMVTMSIMVVKMHVILTIDEYDDGHVYEADDQGDAVDNNDDDDIGDDNDGALMRSRVLNGVKGASGPLGIRQ